jgi:hypothetical protein
MRILKFLFASVLFLVMVGGIGYLGLREVLLFMASNQVQTSVFTLRQISRNPISYVQQCKEKGSIGNEKMISQVRLRFLNDHDYQTEVVCDQFPFDPIVIKKETLPWLTQKLPGSAGIVYGNDHSGVGLTIWGRKRDVVVENQEVSQQSTGTSTYGLSPVSSCGGYGFMCCQPDTQSGVGDVYIQVNDCPKTCYASCKARPVVLSFGTDPFAEGSPRMLTVKNGEAVNFNYVVAAASTPRVLVNLTFGDGQNQEIQSLTGEATHTYNCPTGSCRYTASLTVRDANGGVAAQTPLTQIQVVVTQ